jgi:hypothetical protein
MAPPGAQVKSSCSGRTPLFWQERCLDVWSPKRGLSQKLSCRGVCWLWAQVTQCWCWPEGSRDPGQAEFPVFLMLSQVPCDWIGTEVVFHSLVVLDWVESPLGDHGGVCWLSMKGGLMLVPTGRDLWPWSGWVSCFPNAVSRPVQLDWNRSCVPLTGGPKIVWRFL